MRGRAPRRVAPAESMKQFFFPRLLSVTALAPYRLRTTWSTGETLEVDLEPTLRRVPALAPLLEPTTFARAHLAPWGHGVEWSDSELGADNVYAWATEQSGAVSHEMLDDWMRRNGLSLTTAAQALGMSRRMISYYRTAEKPIPRAVWLACLGWEASQDPRPASSADRPPLSASPPARGTPPGRARTRRSSPA